MVRIDLPQPNERSRVSGAEDAVSAEEKGEALQRRLCLRVDEVERITSNEDGQCSFSLRRVLHRRRACSAAHAHGGGLDS